MSNLSERLAALPPEKRALLTRRLMKAHRRKREEGQIPRRKRNRGTYPLSFSQERMWFTHQWAPDRSDYHLAFYISGPVEAGIMEHCFTEIVRRHEVWRTTFSQVDGQVVQRISPAQPVKIQEHYLAEPQSEVEFEQRLREEMQPPFELSQGPLFRLALFHLPERLPTLLIVVHHIIFDSWSAGILGQEIFKQYEAFLRQVPSRLPELPIQYADYALWQRESEDKGLRKTLAYWKSQLADMPTLLDLPTDHPRPAVRSGKGAREALALSPRLTAALQEFSRQEATTLFMTLLSTFKLLLYRYSGQQADDIVIGTPIANRTQPELKNLLGSFINTLILRTQLDGNLTVRELLRRVRHVTQSAYAHQDMPFEKLIEALQIERDLSHTPLFQVMFDFQLPVSMPLEGITISPMIDTQTAKFDLTLVMMEVSEVDSTTELRGHLEYNTDLFEKATIQRMIVHFQRLLEQITLNPSQRITDLLLLTDAERHQLLTRWDNQHRLALAPFAKSTQPAIHELFEAQVEQTPDAVAVLFPATELTTDAGRQSLTYRELNAKANQVAHHLIRLGVGPDVLVGLCVERSLETVIGILGILKAGGAYLPLDPTYPKERLQFMLADSQVSVIVTQSHLIANLPNHQAHLVCLDEAHQSLSEAVTDWQHISLRSQKNPTCAVQPENLAYCIYTSGSTGQPKGALITHHNVTRLFAATEQWFHFDQKDVYTLFHSYAFDFSVWELWGALLYGGRLVVVPYSVSRSPTAFHDLLCREQVTVLNQTPSAFRQLMRADEGRKAEDLALRIIIFGGEALDLPSLSPWFERYGDKTQLVNMYGITETTVHVTYRPLTRADLNSSRSLIGRPIPDLQLYILDEQLQPVPIGVPGEMYVGGAGVARGYKNRPDLTEERFIANPFGEGRLYKSGDLARHLPNGDVEYLGRRDFQVKIRGFRIELGEIESLLTQHPAVQETIVLAREDKADSKQLVAYIVPKQQPPTSGELRHYLSQTLPDYMIPAVFMPLEAIPLTPNGKVARRALPAPRMTRADLAKEYIAPRTPLEAWLVEKWQQVLAKPIEKIGVLDNFFELGGESIKGAILINQIQEALGEVVHVVVLFDVQTVAQMAAYLEQNYPHAIAKLLGLELPAVATEQPASLLASSKISAAEVRQLRQAITPLPPMPIEGKKNRRAVFILSPPRSGSTLLRVILGGHSMLFAPPELELLSFNTLQERKAKFAGRNSFWLQGTARAIMQIKGCEAEDAFAIMEGLEEEGLSSKAFYHQLQTWLGQQILIDKTPSYALDIEVLKRAEAYFDEVLYIHLLRHPLGGIRSFEKARLDEIFFFRHEHDFSRRELAELIWLISHQNIVEFLKNVPQKRQLQVSFESLVQDPFSVVNTLCDFMGVEFEAQMLELYQDKRERMTDGVHQTSRMLGDMKFHQYKGIDPKIATSWMKDYTVDFLGDVTWQMANALGYEQKPKTAPSYSPLVPIVPIQVSSTGSATEHSQQPFFCVHPVGGHVFCYMELARQLGTEQPFYGLQSSALDGVDQEPVTQIEEMAANYINALQTIQPHGPYQLGGWSLGGLIAFEMAQQLYALGEEVSLLALIDSHTPLTTKTHDNWQRHILGEVDNPMLAYMALDWAAMAGKKLPTLIKTMQKLPANERLSYILAQAEKREMLSKADEPQMGQLTRVFEANRQAISHYQPRPYPGQITYFRATQQLGKSSPLDEWDQLAAKVERYDIAGHHYSILRDPYVKPLAKQLKAVLGQK